jgi:iron complex transport system substrate-binding protein
MKNLSVLFALMILFSTNSCKKETENKEIQTEQTTPRKIVSLSGAITETIAALGEGNQIVGKDVTSTYPEDLKAKDLGHVRSMTIEPIMAVSPGLILASEKDLNPELMSKINETGISFIEIKQEYSVEGAKNLIKNVAGIIGKTDYQPLFDTIDADIAKVQPFDKKPKVLFIYARGAGNLMVSGTGTPMAALIEIAGGENAVTQFADFKTLTPEAVVQANPDVILMFDSGVQSLGGTEGILNVPGVSQTNAGKNKKIITMDGGLISNFGPRTGKAAFELNQKLIETTK